jgi:hypothetical protein
MTVMLIRGRTFANELDRQRTGRIDREMRYEAKQPGDRRIPCHRRVDDEGGLDRQEESKQQSVQERLVIRDNQSAFVEEGVCVAVEPHSKEQPGHEPQEAFQRGSPAGGAGVRVDDGGAGIVHGAFRCPMRRSTLITCLRG